MSGFLAVFSEPGKQVTLDEFHDWYNNEHIPLRLNHLHSFKSGARYSAADGKQPGWLAVYEVDRVSSFQDPSYTTLREKRSDRERELIQRLGVLDRRTCEVAEEITAPEKSNSGFNLGNPSPFVLTYDVSLELKRDGLDEWLSVAKRLDGFVRARIVKALDKAITGVDEKLKVSDVPDYLAILEFDCNPNHEWLESQAIRQWELYMAYPCIAHGDKIGEDSESKL